MELIERLCQAQCQRKQIAAARPRLFRVALAWCGDAMLADDLVQEALALGLQRVHQLRDPERLHAWLYSILNNCWKQYLRCNRPHEDLDEERPCDNPAPENAVGQQQTVTRVRNAVAGLPADQRMVLSLVDLEGLAYNEVALILDIPVGTVMSRLHRARKSLLARLESPANVTPGRVASLKRVK
jgi:RNA polymerase sigma-70 factor, ECF subfamily